MEDFAIILPLFVLLFAALACSGKTTAALVLFSMWSPFATRSPRFIILYSAAYKSQVLLALQAVFAVW